VKTSPAEPHCPGATVLLPCGERHLRLWGEVFPCPSVADDAHFECAPSAPASDVVSTWHRGKTLAVRVLWPSLSTQVLWEYWADAPTRPRFPVP
jgi:hypothetical protein